MTRIVLSVNSFEDRQLLLSLARRLNAKVVQVEEEHPSSQKDLLVQSLSHRFSQHCIEFQSLISPAHSQNVISVFKKTVAHLPSSSLQKLIFSLTDSESIYFRFSLPGLPDSEVHLEVFYSDEENDGIEAVVNIYQQDQILAKRFGKLDEIFQTFQLITQTPAEIA